jgi:hypothetical protein
MDHFLLEFDTPRAGDLGPLRGTSNSIASRSARNAALPARSPAIR